jgi:hypothetical protein
MGKTYRPYLPEQDLLLPPSLQDWLHLAYFLSDLVDAMDLCEIESYYEGEERGYHPTSRFGEIGPPSPQSHVRELGGSGLLGCCSFNNLRS